MNDTTLLEQWDKTGLPDYLFTQPYFIRRDVEFLIRVIIEHVEDQR